VSVRFGILGLVRERPRRGYDLLLDFLALAGGSESWDVKPAQIYATLTRLEAAGLVHASGGEGESRVWGITESGSAELDAWLDSPTPGPRPGDEFFVKLMLRLRLGAGEPRELLKLQRASLLRELHEVQSRRQGRSAESELAHILLLDQAAMRLEADLRWIDMVEARLDDILRQPFPRSVPRPRGRPRKGE
jgi:DNA-binding PadR family transcriptional regulator